MFLWLKNSKKKYFKLFSRLINFTKIMQTMEHQKKTLNLLNVASDSKFVTRSWNIVNNQSNANHSVGNGIIYRTAVLKSNLCDYTKEVIPLL